jgi:membrane-associated phospholipid phosphatase
MQKNKFSHCIVIFVLCCGILFPAGSIESRSEKEEKNNDRDSSADTPFFKCLLDDQWGILTSPFRMKGNDFLLWGGAALTTGILIHNDEAIYDRIKTYQKKNEWVDKVSPKITNLGLGHWNLGIAGAFYLGGLLFKDARAKETARLTVMTFIHTGIVVQLGKHISSRRRPSWDNGVDHWYGPSGFFDRYNEGMLSRYDAFPSGHTISIVGTATVISEMYKKTVIVPILSYAVAVASGLSRITEDTHWLSDVFAGAVLGYAIGKYVVKKRNRLAKRETKEEENKKRKKLEIFPIAQPRQLGIGLTYEF